MLRAGGEKLTAMTHKGMLRPIIEISEALFQGFKHPFSLTVRPDEHWVVLGPKKQYLLEVLAGKHTASPPKALRYPAFGRNSWPSQVISHIVFGQTGINAPYLSARFESFRDEFDYSLETVLKQKCDDQALIDRAIDLLHLSELKHQWFVTLSNGQTRRAHLATALLKSPEVLIIDEPFLGLDPENRALMDKILKSLPMTVIIGAKSAANIPDWATHLAIAGEDQVVSGRVGEIEYVEPAPIETAKRDKSLISGNKPVIELKGITISYRDGVKPVFDNLHLTVREGERLHVKGPNGSGKSTLILLLTADHPKSWNEKVVLFGEPREVGRHSYFSINSDIGSTSPEIHAIFPKHMHLKRVIATAFGEGFTAPQSLSPQQEARIESLAADLGLTKSLKTPFGEASMADQKLALFARALANEPRILILDEAFSTLNLVQIRTAFKVLDKYKGTVLVIGHNEDEIPPCDNVLDLGEH